MFNHILTETILMFFIHAMTAENCFHFKLHATQYQVITKIKLQALKLTRKLTNT